MGANKFYKYILKCNDFMSEQNLYLCIEEFDTHIKILNDYDEEFTLPKSHFEIETF